MEIQKYLGVRGHGGSNTKALIPHPCSWEDERCGYQRPKVSEKEPNVVELLIEGFHCSSE